MNNDSASPPVQGLVSIITPAYNAAAYLPQSIQSVKSQTYANWEWLIADDGSTDETAAIIAAAARDDARIRLLRIKEHSGLAAKGRNHCMRQARGEYLAFLDADDLWEPRKTEIQTDFLQNHPDVDGVCCLYTLFGDPERVKRESGMLPFKPQGFCARREMLYGSLAATPTVMIRRLCYDEIGGMNEDVRLRNGQDYEFFFRLVSKFRIYRLAETLTRVRLLPTEGSLSVSDFDGLAGRKWDLYRAMMEQGLFTREEARIRRGFLHYEAAKDALFHRNAPFRRHLLRSLLTARPPLRAIVMAAFCFLPAPALRGTLTSLMSLRNRVMRTARQSD